MGSYKPAEHEETTSVAPLLQFFELVHVGDTIQSMVQVYFDKDLSKYVDKTDFLNAVMREKKRFETVLDDAVAGGLNAGIEVLMNQASRTTSMTCPNAEPRRSSTSFKSRLVQGSTTPAKVHHSNSVRPRAAARPSLVWRCTATSCGEVRRKRSWRCFIKKSESGSKRKPRRLTLLTLQYPPAAPQTPNHLPRRRLPNHCRSQRLSHIHHLAQTTSDHGRFRQSQDAGTRLHCLRCQGSGSDCPRCDAVWWDIQTRRVSISQKCFGG